MSHAFAAFIEHEAGGRKDVANPPRAITRDTVVPSSPSEYELSEFQWGQRLNGPKLDASVTANPYAPSTLTPRELEQSGPTTPEQANAVDAIVQSWNSPPRNRWRLLGAAIMMVLTGLVDAAAGAVLPYMEKQYHIGYATVSLIFVAQALGFIVAAPLVQAIDNSLGRARSYILVNVLTSTAFVLLICGFPFPVVVFCFFLLGFGCGIFLAMTNLFCVNLLNGTTLLGYMHALYGIGGVLSPLIATAMIARGAKWHYFYAIALALSLTAMFVLGWAFKGFEEDASTRLLTALQRTASTQNEVASKPSSITVLKQAFKEKTTALGAVFILFYQGGEVAISGWVISFLIKYRKENPVAAGNVTSGFWGGVTLGRVLLTPWAPRIGEKLFCFIAIAVAAALQLLVWFVPNLIGAAVAQSLAGFALGPIYPCATIVFSKLLPKSVAISALSFITSMGSSGGALIPLVTGLMAQRVGIVALHPIVLFCFAAMVIAWAMLPRIEKRAE